MFYGNYTCLSALSPKWVVEISWGGGGGGGPPTLLDGGGAVRKKGIISEGEMGMQSVRQKMGY
jgi:hypothetical protein